MNRNGFTLIEILAVIAILGILMGIGLQAYDRYTTKARNEAYDTLAKSSMQAAEEYLFDHPSTTEVNFDTLVLDRYLNNADDPSDNTNQCEGTVRITTENENGAISKNHYIVDMCCVNGNYQYDDAGRKVKTTVCQANFQEEKFIEHDASKCGASKEKTKKFSIYTMNYIDKICVKNKSGKYGGCYDGNNPYGNINYPCRRYDYHQYTCNCFYSKDSSKYCNSTITGQSNHTMKIKYLETTEGFAACNSDAPGDFNSYVHDVCWEGRYGSGKTVMTFHGYQFFKGKSEGYTDFRPDGTWFHDNISGLSLEDRVQRIDNDGEIDYNRGCRDTCIRFATQISKVSK